MEKINFYADKGTKALIENETMRADISKLYARIGGGKSFINGVFCFDVVDGMLRLYYNKGTTPPPFKIVGKNLIYQIKEDF